MRRIQLLLHEEKASDRSLQDAVEGVRSRGHSIEVKVTHEAGDAERFAAEAERDGIDIVAAGGGDGFLNQVINGVFRKSRFPKTAVGIVPLGTANDFASSCGIPNDPFEALLLTAEGSSVMIDVGKADDRLFLNMVSLGFGAEATARTPSLLKSVVGGGAYSLVGLIRAIKMQHYECLIRGPAGEERVKISVMAVGNGRQAGGGFEVTPRAFIDDGFLDLMFIREFRLRDLPKALEEIERLSESTEGQYVHYEQSPLLTVESAEEISISIDGEPASVKSIRFEILPRRLSFILPSHSPLLKNP